MGFALKNSEQNSAQKRKKVGLEMDAIKKFYIILNYIKSFQVVTISTNYQMTRS